MPRYGLGVDTGGTFTDAVIVDLDSGKVLVKAKSPTTHHDLSIGLFDSVRKVFENGPIGPSEIAVAGISTTLATNSVLESKGGEVGLISIGWDPESMDTGAKRQIQVKGGYTFSGKMSQALDLQEVRDAVEYVSQGVDAIAISGMYAVVNPSQERDVKRIAAEMTGLPTIMGTELSSILGVDERARTAVLNGKLISVISKFFDGLESTFRRMGITAPIMVSKGDGSVMSIEKARMYPVESVFSGPAASSVGGGITSGLKDFIMVDIGGTSTDVAIVDDSMPEVRSEGASVCGWRTHVRAVDMYTIALGGDSLIKLQDTKIDLGNGVVIPFFSLSRYKSFNFVIGPDRVIPLCTFAAKYPEVKRLIKETSVCEYYVLTKMPDPSQVTEKCMRIADTMNGAGPMGLLDIRESTKGIWTVDDEVQMLMDLGCVVMAGLTPTDLMVYRNDFSLGDREGSEAGIKALSEVLRMTKDAVVERLMEMVHNKIAEAIITRLLDSKFNNWHSRESMKLVREIISVKPDQGFTLLPRIDVPIVGIGAPTRHMMGNVPIRLGTRLVIPENGDVGNAIGAVCTGMTDSLTASVYPTDDGKFRLMIPTIDSRHYHTLASAIDDARTRLKEILTKRLEADGATDIRVTVKSRYYATTEDGMWTQDDLDHADVIARASGRPPILK